MDIMKMIMMLSNRVDNEFEPMIYMILYFKTFSKYFLYFSAKNVKDL